MKPSVHAHSAKRREMSALTGRLRGQSRKITGLRQVILEILRKHPHPLTSKEIFNAMPDSQCDLATVCRVMQLLQKMGLVNRLDSPSRSLPVALLALLLCLGPAVLVVTGCGNTETVRKNHW
jgi:Fe2+ or Zn2+ uptake regulation protein